MESSYALIHGEEWLGNNKNEFADVEFTDPLKEGELTTYQLYIRGLNVGEVEEFAGEWSTLYSPQGVTGGAMENVFAHDHEQLYKRICGQWGLDYFERD